MFLRRFVSDNYSVLVKGEDVAGGLWRANLVSSAR